ncbi:MAG TPA: substrate-binding domain-containing protein [Intrasporangium sp.]|uniref:LacI family DNA-binding transcriptional regulator n=1 Tax=Intrasporangium sp. TaxID=1925024 RepID=UPI002D7919E7|nr:substrate-binding domain-containing protein [Intrasporangium sp.]HET7396970.1 substrate-binding domain-containing protein [Intrasporangium sp.]
MGATKAGRERATIIDVARAAGVSRQTVSNVLNRPEIVASATRARVEDEIARLGFAPHVAAQQLRRRRASAYGFEVNPSGVGRMGHVLDGFLVELTTTAPGHQSHLVTFAADHDDVLAGYRHLLGTGLVDGFVLGDTRHGDPRPAWLLEAGVPFVAFGRIWDSPELDRWVDVDGRAGMRMAVEHLLAEGYGTVGFLGWPQGSPVGDDRRQGWLDGLARSGLADPALVEESVQDLDRATYAADRLLQRMGGSGAILCVSDMLALGAVRAVRAAGLQPGADIGVVGMDDSDIAEALALSSLRQPLREASLAAWRILQGAAQGGQPALLAPTLIIRNSSIRSQEKE